MFNEIIINGKRAKEKILNNIEEDRLILEFSKNSSLIDDLDQKSKIYEQQQLYNEMLESSFYNREHSQFRNGDYKEAGKSFSYFVNEFDKEKKKFRYGYLFNHTLSPFWINYQNKCNQMKVKKIIDYYMQDTSDDLYFYFVTLTMPNIKIKTDNIDEQVKENSELMRNANNIVNNLNKKIKKLYNVEGFIKKFECTYKTDGKTNYAHPHYHLLIGLRNNGEKRIMKDSNEEQALSTVIFNYWFTSFLKKEFPEIEYNDALAAYDIRPVDKRNIAAEVAGYVSKGVKADYLLNQNIFDHAYQFFFNKRLITYVGRFKEINQLLNLDEVDELEENEAIDKLEENNDEYTHLITFRHYGTNGHRVLRISEIEIEDDEYNSVMNKHNFKPNTDGFGPGLDNSNLSCKSSVTASKEVLQ